MAAGFLCEIKRQDIGLTAYAVHVPGKFSDHGYPIQPKQVLFGSSLFGPSHDNFRSQVGFARELLSAELIEGTENALAFAIIIAERSFLFYQAINVGSKCSMKCILHSKSSWRTSMPFRLSEHIANFSRLIRI